MASRRHSSRRYARIVVTLGNGNVVFTVTDPKQTISMFTVAIDPLTNTATFDPASVSNGFGGPLVLGTYTVSAAYDGLNGSGTPAFNSAGDGPISVDVMPAATTTTLETSLTPAMYGVSITFTATVTSVIASPVINTLSPAGTVSFFDGATLLSTVPLVGGLGSTRLRRSAPRC